MLRIIAEEGAKQPKRGYGLAYRDYSPARFTYWYPVPLNIIVGWLRRLYHFYLRTIVFPIYRPTILDKKDIEIAALRLALSSKENKGE